MFCLNKTAAKKFPRSCQDDKNIFLYFVYKHDAIDIADPRSMNFVKHLAHRRVSVAQW